MIPCPGSGLQLYVPLGAVVPLPRAVPVTLTAAERKTLKMRARGAKTAHRDRLRAQIEWPRTWHLRESTGAVRHHEGRRPAARQRS